MKFLDHIFMDNSRLYISNVFTPKNNNTLYEVIYCYGTKIISKLHLDEDNLKILCDYTVSRYIRYLDKNIPILFNSIIIDDVELNNIICMDTELQYDNGDYIYQLVVSDVNNKYIIFHKKLVDM